MAITSFKRDWRGRGGRIAGVSDNSSSLEWRVTVDNTYDDDQTILNYGTVNGLLPTPLVDRHPRNPLLLCKSVEAKPGAAWKDWRVVAKYDNKPLNTQQKEKKEEQEKNPLNRRARISVSSQIHTRYAIKDLDDKPYESSAGEPFEPQAFDEMRLIFNVRKNVSAIPVWLLDYPDAINKSPFAMLGLQFKKETMKFTGYGNSELQEENKVEFYEISFELHYNPKGWEQPRVDEGFYYLETKTVNGKTKKVRVPFTDITDQGNEVRVSTPQYLDGKGGKLAVDQDPEYLDFEDYRKLDFSRLPLT